MHIGENIRKLREGLNMTQLDFADKIGVSRSAISYIEKKESSDTKLLETISEVFNVSVIELFYGDKNIQPDAVTTDCKIYQVKTVRDIHKNNSEIYRKLSDSEKNFSRSIGVEIYKEVKRCEEVAVDDFIKDFTSKLNFMGDNTVFTYSQICELLNAVNTIWKKNNRKELLD